MPHISGLEPGLDLGADFRNPFSTEVPALLVMSTLDGRTSVESQMEVAPSFRRANIITVVNGGHNVFDQSESLSREVVDLPPDWRGGADHDHVVPSAVSRPELMRISGQLAFPSEPELLVMM